MTDMPRNLMEEAPQGNERDDAALEAQWLANNVPAEPLELRWRYANGSIQLFERHLRSLSNYGIGPALRSYLRTRLEWLSDNKLYERPNGVIVVSVEPNGDVDARLDEAQPVPRLTDADLRFEGGVLRGASVAGSVWVYADDAVACTTSGEEMKGATETFARDLVKTLGYAAGDEAALHQEALANAEILLVNDEFGAVAFEGHEGAFTEKMQACFEKLWARK